MISLVRRNLNHYSILIVVSWLLLIITASAGCNRPQTLSSTSFGQNWDIEATFTKQYVSQGSREKLVLARSFRLIPKNTGITEASWSASSFWYGNYGGSHRPITGELTDEGERVFEKNIYTVPVLPDINLEEELNSLTIVIQWKDGKGMHSETHRFKGLKKYRTKLPPEQRSQA